MKEIKNIHELQEFIADYKEVKEMSCYTIKKIKEYTQC